MTLEEQVTALEAEVVTLKETNAGLVTSNGEFETANKDHEKAIQVAYNKGFDKSKNASEENLKGFINKDDVEAMLSKRDKAHNTQTALLKMGVSNPKRAMKMIDEDDLGAFGSDDFDIEKFKAKYSTDIVFKSEGGSNHKPALKQNTNTDKALTAETYAEMSQEDRSKVSKEERAKLL